MKRRYFFAPLALLVSLLQADTLELRDGQILQGTYQGGSAATLRFETAAGLQVIPIDNVLALTVSRSTTTPTTAPAAAPLPPPAPAMHATVPIGSDVAIRLRSEVSTDKVRQGSKFEATLVNDLRDGSTIVAPQGSIVRGTITDVRPPRRLVKAALLAATLDEIIVGNQILRISTDTLRAETGSDGAIVKGAIKGAVIAEIAGEKAKNGAGAGAALAGLKRGDQISFPPGTVVTFSLSAPLQAP